MVIMVYAKLSQPTPLANKKPNNDNNAHFTLAIST